MTYAEYEALPIVAQGEIATCDGCEFLCDAGIVPCGSHRPVTA